MSNAICDLDDFEIVLILEFLRVSLLFLMDGGGMIDVCHPFFSTLIGMVAMFVCTRCRCRCSESKGSRIYDYLEGRRVYLLRTNNNIENKAEIRGPFHNMTIKNGCCISYHTFI